MPSCLLLFAVYVVAGCLCLGLTIGPTYASPLFPSAGIALAAIYTLGPRLLPAVALGAITVNLFPLANGVAVDGSQALAALAAGAGAALQAGIAMLFLRRTMQPAIGASRHVLTFMLSTPVLATISSTVSMTGAVLLGKVAPADMALNWFTWWLGDTIGILLAAPLTWIAIGQPRVLWRRRRMLVGLPLLLSGTVFIAIYFQAEHWESAQQMQTFRLKAQQAGDMLQAQFSEHERFLHAMSRALGDPRRTLAADDFSALATGYLDKRPELASMSWLVPVRRDQRDAFEQWGKEQLAPDFEIREVAGPQQLQRASDRELYMVPTFIEPPRTRLYRGIDLLSEPLRSDAVIQALRTGQPAASAPLNFLQKQSARALLLLQAVHPVGGGESPGMLMISLQVEPYLQRMLQQVNFPSLLVRLEDITGGTGMPLVDHVRRPARNGDVQRVISFGGRQYMLLVAPTPAYAAAQRGWQSWTVLTCGLLLTALLGGMMLLISGERAQIQAQVKDSTARLREREARLQAILDKAADAILTIGLDGVVLSANGAAGRLFGYPPERMAGVPLATLLPPRENQTPAELLRLIASGDAHEYEALGYRSDSSDFPLAISVSEVELPDEHLFVAILHDLTEQRRAQEHIHRLAHNDPLTGLDNRLSLNLRLDQLLARARRMQGTAAVMFIDLDHFKKINDTHGHQTGDLLLVAVANRLRDMLREVDTIARLGGDEFIIVTDCDSTPETAAIVAVRIVEALAAPFMLAGKTVHTGTSVGVAMYPADGEDSATLLRHADTAMYAAKSQGRGNFQFFSSSMNRATHERLLMENRLSQALEKQEFELYLQPQVAMTDGRIIGAEALLRWHHPELGMISPDRFIPIAEESGLILPLGDWVLRRAAQLLVTWREQGLGHLRLAVNLSARQCRGTSLVPLLDKLLADNGIAAAQLELEITESAAMQDPESSRTLLQALRARGIKVAIDDFGTGYSSLSYLKEFKLDRLKIDRSFVKDIETDPNDAVIVSATIALAHSLGLEVTAEGVETEAQRAFLCSKGCETAQGYLFAKPMPVEQFEAMAAAITA
nr:EAL domain-containing protein [Pseudoduganella ginsengisoli]